jgi:hypothetical protein
VNSRHPSVFGEYAVRFQAGATLAQMSAAVTAAGGTVTNDMHQIAAVETVSADPLFPTRLSANPIVSSVFIDSTGASEHAATVDADFGSASGGSAPKVGGADGLDPWHSSYQWDDAAMNVPPPSATTGSGITVGILDSGVDVNQRDTGHGVTETQFIPCATLSNILGKQQVSSVLGIGDCGSGDAFGHGTWLTGRIAGALNGFASNGIAPGATVLDQKALADVYGFDSAWVIAAMLDACDRGANVINMSLHEYDDAAQSAEAQNYLLWVDAVNYCRAKGTVLVAAAGNDHVQIDRLNNVVVGGRTLNGVGVVSNGAGGIGLTGPITPTTDPAHPPLLVDERGMLIAPSGVPGVIMVSATGLTTADPTGLVSSAYAFPAGLKDQLAYYSSYGSRVDIAAPGGARSLNVPIFDASGGDGVAGYGVFGPTTTSASLCTSLSVSCIKVNGDGFMWIQGTSMSTADVTGAIAQLLATHPEFLGHPDAVLSRLQSTARKNMANLMGPMSASSATTLMGPCPTGYCHLDNQHPIPFSSAYGAGIVNLAAAEG